MVASACGPRWSSLSNNNVAVIKVEGPIFQVDDLLSDIKEAGKDASIRAVVVRLESPGGSVASSQEVYEEVKKLALKKPVVASMGNVAASGAYYIAAAANKILANPGTITGSIGVRMEHVNISELYKLLRMEHETLKSGRLKDMGSTDRPLRPEERELLEGILKDMHEQFKDAVAEGRKIPRDMLELIADGRVYTGRQAIPLNLVDKLGTEQDAIAMAAEMAGIKGEPKVLKPKKRSSKWMRELFGDASAELVEILTKELMSGGAPSALYIWRQ